MIPCELWNCTDMLLSIICYEIHRDKLSPEMEAILADHLAECESCRTRFLNFRQLLEEKPETTTCLQ